MEKIYYDQFMEIVEGYVERVEQLILAKLERYTGIKPVESWGKYFLNGLALHFLWDIRGEREHAESGPPEICYTIKININREPLFITFLEMYIDKFSRGQRMILCEPHTKLLALKDYMYCYSYNNAYFKLDVLKDERFLELLTDDIIYQMGWKSVTLYRLFKKCPDSAFQERFEEAMLDKEFINRFELNGFQVNAGRVCCSGLDRYPHKHRPPVTKMLLLGYHGRDLIAGFHEPKEDIFYRLPEVEPIKHLDYWTYEDAELMDEYLKQFGLEDYRKHILIDI